MPKKLIAALVSIMVALVLVFASCGPKEEVPTQPQTVTGTATQTQTTTTTAPSTTTTASPTTSADKPIYGGRATFHRDGDQSPDPSFSTAQTVAQVMYESLCMPDWKLGPSGTGVFSNEVNYAPETFWIGALAISWEQTDLQTIKFQIRPGVRFWNKPPVNGRELTANDVVFSLEWQKRQPKATWYKSLVTATAADKYTVIWKLPDPDGAFALRQAGLELLVVPREIIDAYGDTGFEDWTHACGTGPFMITDFVRDSSVTYKKNPAYWQEDPLHKGNQLPYVDGLIGLLVTDRSTLLSALRTGKLDRLGTSSEEAKDMFKTNPKLNYRKLLPSTSDVISMQTKQAPFNDIKVRKALHMAIDYQGMTKDYYGGDAEMITWPMIRSVGPDIWTELNQMPAATQELFSHNVQKAKQLLTDAGFPSGFKVKITTPALYVDRVTIVKQYFKDIGVELEIEVFDQGTYVTLMLGHTFKDMCASFGWGTTNPYSAFRYAYRTSLYGYSSVDDPYFDQTYLDIIKTVDVVERNKKLRDLRIKALDQAYWIQLPTSNAYVFWQPWIKGYKGEYAVGRTYNYNGIWNYAWIDPTLK